MTYEERIAKAREVLGETFTIPKHRKRLVARNKKKQVCTKRPRSREEAEKLANDWHKETNDTWTAYYCERCSVWHIGHRSPNR